MNINFIFLYQVGNTGGTKYFPYPLEVVKKFNIVVTPSMTLAGTAFHSIQNVTKDEVTKIMPDSKKKK